MTPSLAPPWSGPRRLPIAPVMIYGDDVSHVVTEEGVAYLYKAHSLEDRRAALAAIASTAGVQSAHAQATTGWAGAPRQPAASRPVSIMSSSRHSARS